MPLRFRPTDTSFYDMFSESAKNLVAGAELLAEMLSNGADQAQIATRMREAEHQGDEITHGIVRKVNTTFVTPFDREDIYRLAAGAISLGTYSGGWRIMRTMGRRIIHLDPPRAFSAESTAASILYITAYVYHAPISTTQVITSGVMGAGATRGFNAVRWGVAKNIGWAWVLTFPAAGLVAAVAFGILNIFLP